MQCASSTARRHAPHASTAETSLGSSSLSGATYRRSSSPSRACDSTAARSGPVCALVRQSAATPAWRSDPTWSAMSEIRGDTTTATPGSMMAGTW